MVVLLLGGCGEDDVDRLRDDVDRVTQDVRDRLEDVEREFEERRDRFGKRIEEVFAEFEKAFQRPERTDPDVRSRGLSRPDTIEGFLTAVLKDIDEFWTKTFATNGLPEPRVFYNWPAPGSTILTACGERADDNAAFYCPADDTIYVAQRFAAAVYAGTIRGFPGESAGGRAAGDFAVAYVVAHEYAHNLQMELGIFNSVQSQTAKPFELQADCLAGVWAYSSYAEGEITDEDIREATSAVLAVGDFDVSNAQHHGTPQERVAAFTTGLDTGDPGACSRFLV
jgi:predicted metalloprotease